MRYLADLLTLTRFILSIILITISFTGGSPEAAFIIFLTAEFTDTFDGTCARKWPFPKNKTPKYRKYAAQYDMISDVLLAAGHVLFCTLQVRRDYLLHDYLWYPRTSSLWQILRPSRQLHQELPNPSQLPTCQKNRPRPSLSLYDLSWYCECFYSLRYQLANAGQNRSLYFRLFNLRFCLVFPSSAP